MRPLWAALYFVLTAGLLCAQTLPNLEIKGRVMEPVLDIGIAGAEVELIEFALVDHTVTRVTFHTTFTDSTGAFRFQPLRLGDYYVEVRKEGYQAPNFGGPESIRGSGIEAPVSLTRESPTQEIRFSMIRPGGITGQVLYENREPAAGLRVSLQQPVNASSVGSLTATTAADGSFTIPQVPPGEFFVRISPQSSGIRVRAGFAPEEAGGVDQVVETSFWPGGLTTPSGTPLRVSPGTTASTGTIVVRTTPHYRVHVFAHESCAPGGPGRILQFSRPESNLGSLNFTSFPCGPEFLIENLSPGSYVFMFSGGSPASWALAPVTITTRNVDLDVTFSPAVDISGRLIASDPALILPLTGLQVRATALDGPSFPPVPGNTPSVPNSEGGFIIKRVLWPRHQIRITGLDPKFYVREVRYSGRAAEQGIITVAPGAELEIVIDDKAASVAGTVTAGDKPAVDGFVLAMPWPLPPPAIYNDFEHLAALRQGQFQLGGLAPGEYRIIAVPPSERARLADGAVLSQLLSRVETIRLGPSETRTLTLKMLQ